MQTFKLAYSVLEGFEVEVQAETEDEAEQLVLDGMVPDSNKKETYYELNFQPWIWE